MRLCQGADCWKTRERWRIGALVPTCLLWRQHSHTDFLVLAASVCLQYSVLQSPLLLTDTHRQQRKPHTVLPLSNLPSLLSPFLLFASGSLTSDQWYLFYLFEIVGIAGTLFFLNHLYMFLFVLSFICLGFFFLFLFFREREQHICPIVDVCGTRRTTFWSWLSRSTLWLLEMELRSSDLDASTPILWLPHWPSVWFPSTDRPLAVWALKGKSWGTLPVPQLLSVSGNGLCNRAFIREENQQGKTF